MAIGSVLKTVRDNLHTQLSARAGLSGVTISKYNPIESAKKEKAKTGRVKEFKKS